MSNRFYSGNIQGDLFFEGRTEIDMRQELNNTFDGVFPEISKAQVTTLRKMRRIGDQTTGDLIACGCVDPLTHEPDLDVFCPICHGEAYLWDEIFVDSYKIVLRSDVGKSTKEDLILPGLKNIPLVIFYMRSSVLVTSVDKIIELITDTEGKPVIPYSREFLYRIGTVIDFRSDNGRLEYWKLDCYAEQRKFLNGPKP